MTKQIFSILFLVFVLLLIQPLCSWVGSSEVSRKLEKLSSASLNQRYQVSGIREGDVLNIRDGPHWEKAIVGTLSPGAKGIKFLGKTSMVGRYEWWLIESPDGSQGWVNSLYLKPMAEEISPIVPKKTQPQSIKSYGISLKQVTVFFGPDFYDLLKDTIEISNLKLSPDRRKIAFTVWDRSMGVFDNLAIVNIDGSDKKFLVEEEVEDFAWLNNLEIIYKLYPGKLYIVDMEGASKEYHKSASFDSEKGKEIGEVARIRINEFLESEHKPHEGVLGGTVIYKVLNYEISLDREKIAFFIRGDDGHAFFNPTWYVCNYDGENITLIDSTSENMGENVVWLSANEVAYIKDATLWRAVIR